MLIVIIVNKVGITVYASCYTHRFAFHTFQYVKRAKPTVTQTAVIFMGGA